MSWSLLRTVSHDFQDDMLTLLLCSAIVAASALAQATHSTNFSEFWNVTSYPDAQVANVSALLYQASDLAGYDLDDHFQRRCIISQVYGDLADNAQAPGVVSPIEVFDGVYFVGQSAVSAWVIATTSGFVVIDTLNNAEEAESILIPGLRAFGFTGDDIVAVIITHEHFDHYSGARWLQETCSAPIYASELAWQAMKAVDGAPERNQAIIDDQELDFGNFSLRFMATPGHTPGAMSLIFPVSDHGRTHLIGMNGQAGIAANASAKEDHIHSYAKFAAAAEEASVDTLVANHQTQDRSLTNFDLLNARKCTAKGFMQADPLIIDAGAFVRYLEVQALCVRVQAARSDQTLTL